MGFYEAINAVLGPVLGPLKIIGPFYVILLVSFLVSLIVTLVYKWTTDQELMKNLKDDIKKLQQEMKKLKDNPGKMMKVQKEAMDKNMKYMVHSFKSTLITFIPLILIFGWLQTNFAYAPLEPGKDVSTYVFFENSGLPQSAELKAPEGIKLVTDARAEVKKSAAGEKLPFNNPHITSSRYGGFLDAKEDIYYAGWRLNAAEEGTYQIEYDVNNMTYYKDVLVSRTEYNKPMDKIDDGTVKGILVDEGKLIVMNLFGWKLGWLGAYIIFSILFSTLTRKVMKVY